MNIAAIIRDAETRTKAETDKKAREILSVAIDVLPRTTLHKLRFLPFIFLLTT